MFWLLEHITTWIKSEVTCVVGSFFHQVPDLWKKVCVIHKSYSLWYFFSGRNQSILCKSIFLNTRFFFIPCYFIWHNYSPSLKICSYKWFYHFKNLRFSNLWFGVLWNKQIPNYKKLQWLIWTLPLLPSPPNTKLVKGEILFLGKMSLLLFHFIFWHKL